jgi:flagellar motility protein MotE (MotC chaperone)
MEMDFTTLVTLRKMHPAWRLLMADNAPLIASFLHRVFIAPNVRVMAQVDLESRLEDALFHLRETEGKDIFPRSAADYLNEWAQNDKGWLRKFYPPGSDEAHFDLTPAVEKAIAWLEGLTQRAFVGTESRLMTVFELLRQMVEGAETDTETRISELEKRKQEINREIDRIRSGDLVLLDDTALRDRFQQVSGLARELLSDFREVEHNFRQLDRNVREQIATWEGRKGELLERIFGERDAISDSDQGKSFRAFWDFLMSPARQEELSALLEKVFTLNAIGSLNADPRLKRIHYDWMEAGEYTQRTVAKLSQQLRRYLDDQAYLENKRIMQLLQEIEASALAVRDEMPKGAFMEMDEVGPTIQLPMERPLFSPPVKPVIAAEVLNGEGAEIAVDALFEQVIVDQARLRANIRRLLQSRNQVTLRDVLHEHPVENGLAEVVAYLIIACADARAIFDENEPEQIFWLDGMGRSVSARLPRLIFSR